MYHKDVVVVVNRHDDCGGPTGRAKNVCRHEISSRAEGTRASQKGPLDGAGDLSSFSIGMVDPRHSSRDMLVNLTLQLTRTESLSVIKGETCRCC